LGSPAPKNPAQFQEQACAAAAALNADRFYENNGTGGWLWELDSLTILSWLAAFDAHPEVPVDGTYQFQTENAAAGFSFLRTLLDGGCCLGKQNHFPYEIFASRRALFFLGQPAGYPGVKDCHAIPEECGCVDGHPIPRSDGDRLCSLQVLILPFRNPNRPAAGCLDVHALDAGASTTGAVDPGRGYLSPLRACTIRVGRLQPPECQWETALAWIPESQPAPADARWRTVRSLLQDAAWQIAQPYLLNWKISPKS
jgi:hypothetical protein